MTPQEIADRSTAAMWDGDEATRWFGIELSKVGPGCASTTLTVQDHHLNGHKICHGGVIFALADTAFAFACNSYNQLAVAQHNTISFVAPGKRGEILTATATETSTAGRSGIYDVTVTGENGRVIAEFRGVSRAIPGQHFEEIEVPS